MAELKCWNCGTSLDDIPLPISRHANCPTCFNELHCCRLCANFDASIAADQCAEELADPPMVKTAANFCEWFTPSETAYRPEVTSKRQAARAQLDALFGGEGDDRKARGDTATDNQRSEPLNKQEEARAKLDRLFATDDPKSED